MGNRTFTALGHNLRHHRRRKKLSQVQLAEASGVSRSVIAVVESGRRRNIATATLERLATALGRTPADLLRDPPPTEIKQAS